MGLLDILNGMQNGPRGPSGPSTGEAGKSEGMSPMTMAILAILAYKAVKHFGGGGEASAKPAGGSVAVPEPAPSQSPSVPTGGLSDLLKGGLGGLLAGGAAGTILSGGLGDLLKQLQQNGQAEAADSWVGRGENKAIAPDDLATALGADQISALTSRTGLSRQELLSELSRYLPEAVDQFTPDGRVPSERDISRWL